MVTLKLIEACIKNDRLAQKEIYYHFLPKMNSVGKRYLKKSEEIDEALSETFFIAFTKINQLKERLHFEAWLKRIMINECLRILKKQQNFNVYIDDMSHDIEDLNISDKLEETYLLKIVNELPEGCRAVFNLFVIEGYSHQEIADMLMISVGTSKSQLNFAKKRLQEVLKNYQSNAI